MLKILRGFLLKALPADDWSREFISELDAELERARADGRVRWTGVWYARQLVSPRTLHFVWMMRRRKARGVRTVTRATNAGRVPMLRGLRADLRQACRGVLRDPRTGSFIVLTLALGIGSVTAMYGVAERLFLSGPKHVHAPEQLARVYLTFEEDMGPRASPWIPYRTALALQESAGSFTKLTLYRTGDRLAQVGENVQSLRVSEVDGAYFEVLGVVPSAGRFFGSEVDGGDGPAVLSTALARAAFGGVVDAIGRTIDVAGKRFSVVAVAPEGFAGPHLLRVDVWVPVDRSMAGSRNWWTIGRLPGVEDPVVERGRAAAEADAVHRTTDPGRFFRWASDGTVILADLSSDNAGETSAEASIARMLMVLVAVVLLIAGANSVNLLLARLTRRRREVAVRLALGVGRWRLVRLLISESVILGLVGGLLSIPVALGAGQLLRGVLLPNVAWTSSPVDVEVLLVTTAVALATGILLGLLPGRYASRTDLTRGLASDRTSSGSDRVRTQAVLAITQITLSAALLMCAGLFIKSFWTLRVTDLGLEADEVMAVSLRSLDTDALAPGSGAEREMYGRALAALRDLEGAERSAVTVGLPFMYTFGVSIWVPGLDSIPQLPGGGPYLSAVSGGYFDAIGTRILRGAPISGDDVAAGDNVVVVSESMASTLWPDTDALGPCVRLGGEANPCLTVVGVATDVHRRGYREPPSMQVYIPLGQERGFGGMALVVRPSRSFQAVSERVATTLRRLDPAIDHVERVRLDALLDAQVRPWRLGAVVLTLAASLAVLVSLVGVYGVLSYLVAQRRREIGVRMALGASQYSIRGMVVRAGALSGGIGVSAGVGLVLAGSRWLDPLLFETTAADPVIIGLVGSFVITAALLACLLPASHAARIDPAACLREV